MNRCYSQLRASLVCALYCLISLPPLLYAVLEPVIVWAMGYLAYMLADGFSLSGIIRCSNCSVSLASQAVA